MSPRRVLRIALAAFGVAAIALSLLILVREEGPREPQEPLGKPTYGGPLQDEGMSEITAVGDRGAVGEPVSFGLSLAWNAAASDAVLDGLVPLSPSEGIEVVGAGVMGPEHPSVGFESGYPPKGTADPPPIRGYRIPPGTSMLDARQVVVGVQATEPGVHFILGFEIRYHVEDARYRAVVFRGVWLCVPRDEKPACPGKGHIAEQQEELSRELLPLVQAPPR